MTTKERLHQLVDDLPESEVATAERVLAALRDTAEYDEGRQHSLDDAPEEDATEEEVRLFLAAKARIAAGERLIPQDEAERIMFGNPN